MGAEDNAVNTAMIRKISCLSLFKNLSFELYQIKPRNVEKKTPDKIG
jgi:hypothetical protein